MLNDSTDDPRAAHLQRTLAEANGFLLDAVPDNREGRLTVDQARLLRQHQATDRSLLSLLGLAMVILSGFWIGAKVAHGEPHVLTSNRAALAVFAAGLFLIWAGLRWKSYRADFAAAGITSVEGPGKKIARSAGNPPASFYYAIGGIEFPVPAKAYAPFIDGLLYRAYYLTDSGTLVNLEVCTPATPPIQQTSPTCPVCSQSDKVRSFQEYYRKMQERAGCLSFLPFIPGSQHAEARTRQRLSTLSHLPPLYICRRNHVVFISGTGEAIRQLEMMRMLQEGENEETLLRALGQPSS